MVIPSFYNSLHDSSVYPDPDSFSPERWLDPSGLANSNPKNYLVFGSGPHRCIGLEYATMNMTLVLATACAMMDWEHEVTPLSNTVEYVSNSQLLILAQRSLAGLLQLASLKMVVVSNLHRVSIHKQICPIIKYTRIS